MSSKVSSTVEAKDVCVTKCRELQRDGGKTRVYETRTCSKTSADRRDVGQELTIESQPSTVYAGLAV